MATLAQWNMAQAAPSVEAKGISASNLANTQGLPTYGLESPGYATDPVLRVGAASGAISAALALSLGSYWEITITPAEGATMSLSRLVVEWGRAATTARYGFIRGSHDGYASDLHGPVQVAGLLPNWDAASPDIDLSGIAALQEISAPVTFRFYCYAASTGRPIDWDNLTIEGTVVGGSGAVLPMFGGYNLGKSLLRGANL